MSKQVRLRRGTTAQHATFTGADGEVTFDTTKKCLVLHDGVTAGGKPVEGWVKLTTGAVLILTILVEILKAGGSWAAHYVASLLSKGAINPPVHP